MTVLEQIEKCKVVAIVRGISSDKLVELTRALVRGGVNCVEVTFDQANPETWADTQESIRLAKKALGDQICVGAGTVMSVEQVHLAVDAGAEYMISPNVNPDVIRETKRLGKVSIPGAMTPSEIATAYDCGADVVKLFPAGELGTGYLKAIRSPLKHIPLMATGGVNVDNCAEFLKAGSSCLGIGGNLVSKKLIDAGHFDEITAIAAAYHRAVESV